MSEALPRSREELVGYLSRRCQSFARYWDEIGSVHSAASPADAPADDALWEFARHSLELYQDGKKVELRLIIDLVTELIASRETRSLGKHLLELIRSDWSGQMTAGQTCFEAYFADAIGAG